MSKKRREAGVQCIRLYHNRGSWWWTDEGCGYCGSSGKVDIQMLQAIVGDCRELIETAVEAAEDLGFTREEVMGEVSDKTV